ncbi:MAG: putative integrase [Candidatus Midichloriaceae bacterium]|nr:putative integrase [Candidatus Midichloriaceae bacterium]
MSPEQAKAKAFQDIALISKGINPNVRKRELRGEATFAELFQRYLDEYAKVRKRSWKSDLGSYNRYLRCLDNKKISNISRNDIERLHNSIKVNAGLYAANRSLALLKIMFNKANHWGYNGMNPANGIKKFQEQARDRALQPDEIGRFFKALNEESNFVLKAYFYISLLTGARRGNVLSMRWSDISFGANPEWRIETTKNGEIHIVSLVPQAVDILKELRLYQNSEWVFPSDNSKSGHIEEPKKAWKRILANAEIKDLRIHDLRRTLASWQVRTGANSFVIGKTLGHKNQQATAIYARVSKDVARDSMQDAVDAMFKFK